MTETGGRPNLLVILGPTASGKTRLAVAVARHLNGEIISADSRQVFRRMDLGTGKDLAEYGEVPCHLTDILEPGGEFSVFAFQQLFADAFKLITDRGHLPILAGGTGLYLDAVLRGYRMPVAPEDAACRAELADLPLEQLQSRLLAIRPQQHNNTDLQDRERLIRAIEIAGATDDGDCLILPELRPLIFGIRIKREVLRQRITARLKERLAAGMIDEVAALLAEGVPAARLESYGLEYRYLTLFLTGRINRNDMYQKLNSAIHDFAKRQETWFRRMEKHGVPIFWLDEGEDMPGRLLREYGRHVA